MKLSIWKALLLLITVLVVAILVVPNRRELGRVHLLEREYGSARAYLEEHYEEYPLDIPSSLRYLEILEQGLEFEEYNKVAEELLSQRPGDARIHAKVAAHHEGNLRLEEAAKHWRITSTLDPADQETRAKLVAYYHLDQDYASLVDFYQEEIEKGVATPAMYYDLARIYTADEQEDRARGIYSQILTKWPGEIEAKVRLAALWEEEGRIDEALAFYEIVAEENTKDKYAAQRFLQKSAKYRRGDGSGPALNRYLARFPRDIELLLAIATHQLETERMGEALATLGQVQSIDPLNVEALLLQARVYIEMGEHTTALAKLEEYQASAPEDFRVHGKLGDLHQNMNLRERAIEEYRTAVSLFEEKEFYSLEDELIYLWIRVALEESGDLLDQSRYLFKEYPANPEVALLLFTVALHNRDTQLGEEAYRAYLRFDPASPQRLNMAAQLHVARGEWKEAKAVYEKIVAAGRATPAQKRDFAVVLSQVGDHEEAIAMIEEANRLDPTERSGWLVLAEILANQRKYKQALAAVETYNKVTGGDLASYGLMGDIQLAMDEPDKARSAWEKGAEIAGNREEPLTDSEQVALVWIYVKLEEFEKAQEGIDPLLKLSPRSPEALAVAAHLLVEAKEHGEASQLIDELAGHVGEKERVVVELRILQSMHRRNWNEAERWILMALDREPDNRDRLRELAFVSTQLHQYVRARGLYRQLCALGLDSRAFRWEQRAGYLEGASMAFCEAEMLWAEDGLRYQAYREGARGWWGEKLRVMGALLQGHYQQLGDSRGQIAIMEDVFGAEVGGEWFPDQYFIWSGVAGVRHLHSTLFPVVAGAGRFQRDTTIIEASGIVNDLMFIPLNALPLETRRSRARFLAEDLYDDFFRYGIAAWWEWYRFNPRLNPFNTGGDLGDKWFLEPFIGFVVISDSFRYIEFFATFRAADWNQGFDNAVALVDLLRRERAARVGMGWRQKWRCMELEGSASEGYDWARRVNSVFLQSILHLWWTNCDVGSLGFEYQIGDSGLAGQGNSWRMFGAVRMTF